MFSVRIVTVNHYLARPVRDLDVAYSDFRGSEVKQVPVLRIFGATPAGQKTCLHIHGVFPYIYVGCGLQEFTADKDLRLFATSLDLALQVATGKASENTQHVFKVISVQAVPMYGYHSRSRRFLKVYFYNPLMVKRAVELLQSGAVMNKVFQPHEAHIPFILQFFIDYNLYGMNLIHLAAVKFRQEKPENDGGERDRSQSETSSPDTQPVDLSSLLSGSMLSSQRWNRENIPSGLLLDAEIQRQSVCELEVDAVAMDILNRHELQGNTEMNPGLLAIYNEERERREVKGQLDDLHPPSSPDRGVIEDTESELKGKARLADIIQERLGELRALAGGSEEDDSDDSVLQDTLAGASLPASQLILHDSQYAGEDDSVSTPEEESQPVVNEELVHSVVEASQHSSQYSQQPGGEDRDLAQLLVDLAQDGASPEDGSILSSQNTQEERRRAEQEDEEQEEDEDAQESLEMSQAWDDGCEEEGAAGPCTIHDISASEEDTQGSQDTAIPQFDGGSDEKQAPTRKKNLGLKRHLPKVAYSLHPNPLGSSSTAQSPFPPEIKTYANKKLLLTSPEKAQGHADLTPAETVQIQKAVFQQVRNLDDDKLKQGHQKRTRMPPTIVNRLGAPAIDAGPTVALKASLQTRQDSISLGGASLQAQWLAELARDKMLKIPQAVQKKSLKGHVAESTTQLKSTANGCSGESVTEDKAPFVTDPTSDTNTAPPPRAKSSVPELLKVPSSSDAVHFEGCKELKGYSNLDDVKKDSTWNPVVMLIKCPIQTDFKGRIAFSGTSLPQQQLEQIRKDNLKAVSHRRSSFSRRIVPPRKFMDEQFFMDQIQKVSKQKNVHLLNSSPQKCDSGLPQKMKRGRPRKHHDVVLETEGKVMVKEKPKQDGFEIANEPPCLISPAQLAVVENKLQMPILEKMACVSDTCPAQLNEKKTVTTKTKAMLQEKYYKRLISSDKKKKLSRKAPHSKLYSKRDVKRYRMLSRTFNKLSLAAEEHDEAVTSVKSSEPLLSSALHPLGSETCTLASSTSATPPSGNTGKVGPVAMQPGPVLEVGSSRGQSSSSSTAHSEPAASTQQIKKSSPGTRKRQGSDSSDDWSERRTHYKRKSSQLGPNEFDPMMYGRTYGLRKKERVSYDDGFPDVGFDIMCWSDEEDSVEVYQQNSEGQHQKKQVNWHTKSESPRVENTPKYSDSYHLPRDQAAGEQPWSPPRKRGRPLGSKNKSKLTKSHFPQAEDGKSCPSPRSKQQLSFTIDSMLNKGKRQRTSLADPVQNTCTSSTGEKHTTSHREPVAIPSIPSVTSSEHTTHIELKQNVFSSSAKHSTSLLDRMPTMSRCSGKHNTSRVPTISAKPSMIIATSHSSLIGTPDSRPTTHQSKTVSPLSTSVSTSEQHRARSRPKPIPTAVNGHRSEVHDATSEPALYRDAMWNLGYFSPQRKEKEGSPPRCWSPSVEKDSSARSQQPMEDVPETAPRHRTCQEQEPGKRMKLTDDMKGSKKKKVEDSKKEGKLQTYESQEGNKTNYKQLITSNSRSSNGGRGPEFKQMCNTDNLNEMDWARSKLFDGRSEDEMENDQHKTQGTKKEQTQTVTTDDGQSVVETLCPERVGNRFTIGRSSPPIDGAKDSYSSEAGSQESPLFERASTAKTLDHCPVQTKQEVSADLNSPSSRVASEEADVVTKVSEECKTQVGEGVCPQEKTIASSSAGLSQDFKEATDGMASAVEVKGHARSGTNDFKDVPVSLDSPMNQTLVQNSSDERTSSEGVCLDGSTLTVEDTDASSPGQDAEKAGSLDPSSGNFPEGSQDGSHPDDNITFSDNRAQISQRKQLDCQKKSSTDSDSKTPDLDSNLPSKMPDLGSETSSSIQTEHGSPSLDRKVQGDEGCPSDMDLSPSSSSDDITPAQRMWQSPSRNEEEGDESDDMCNLSHSSSSTGASLSLDMSLIISRVPSISPTRESEGHPLSGYQLISPEDSQEKVGRDQQKAIQKVRSVHEMADERTESGEFSSTLNLSQDTSGRGRAMIGEEAGLNQQRSLLSSSSEHMDDRNPTSALISGSQTCSLGLSSSGESGMKESTAAGVSESGLVISGTDLTRGQLQSDNHSDDSDSFSQLVCPETPSPIAMDDASPVSMPSQLKPTSYSESLSPARLKPVAIEDNTKASILPSPGVKKLGNVTTDDAFEKPRNSTSEAKVESASETDLPHSPRIGIDTDSSEEVEPMEIDTSQEESRALDLSHQSSSHQTGKVLEQSQHPGYLGHPHTDLRAVEKSPVTAKPGRPPSPSGEDCAVKSERHFQLDTPLESGAAENIAVSHAFKPSQESYPLAMSTCISIKDQTLLSASHQDSRSCTKDRPEFLAVTSVPSQQSESVHQQTCSTHLAKDDAKAVRNQTSLGSAGDSQTAPVCQKPPVASSLQCPDSRESQTRHTSPAVAMSRPTTSPETQSKIWTPAQSPPSAEMVRASLLEFGLPQLYHQRAFCRNPDDVHHPSKPGVHDDGHVQSNLPSRLPEAESQLTQTGLGQWRANLMALDPHPLLSPSITAPEPALRAALIGDGEAVITPCRVPPSRTQVQSWLQEKDKNGPLERRGDNKETEGEGCAEKQESRSHPAPHLLASKHPSQVLSEGLSHSTQNNSHSVMASPQTDLQSKDRTAASQLHTPRVTLPHWEMNCPPLPSKSISTPLRVTPFSSPTLWSKSSSQPPGSTPPTEPFARRGNNSQLQHSTPLRIDTGAGEVKLPVTPISGWKRPMQPSSAGGSRQRHPSSSSMRQTLLFTPKESSGIGKPAGEMSQIEGATPSNTCGFKMPQLNMQDAKTMHEVQHLTIMSLELHVRTRRDYLPDPESDPIRALFYSIKHDTPSQGSASCSQQDDALIHSVIIVDDSNHGNAGPSTSSHPQDSLAHAGISNIRVTSVASETDLLDEILAIVRTHDPDILVGYEIQQHSWGFLLERAAFLDMDLCTKISRLPEFKKESSFSAERDAYGADHQSEINIAGRITLNLWRLMRHEVALTNYSFENVAFHVLHQRVPLFTYRKLSDWFDHRNPQLFRWRVIEYYSVRVRGSLKLLQQLDLIGRTSELARVFGFQFYSVLSRGSQFRVESMMLRTAKPQNYVALSPSVQQRSRMKAPECIPLVMEPESRFYQDPVIVLDFQSLYPTVMIAYNYCYSTCLGRLEHIANGGEYVLGCGSLSVTTSQLKKLLQSDSLNISPNGVVFVKPSVRRGVLPTMLEQILKLRVIVKKALKDFKDDKSLHRMLDNRQLALKLIANVTYGYTSANFSGRMPCIEVGDSVVRKSRETLERAIHMVETTKKWGARVVYGDTDSMFVLVEGASKERAFEVGREIRDAVTAANPKPVKLKLEKVYHPCVLQSKKRYVGYSYESPDQVEPDFDAKGIETVRRDSCPAVGKILEKALKILFTTRDVSQIKQYVQRQFQKILDGQASLQDLIFAKEYRGRHTYRPGACVPALEISRRLLSVDRRAEPRVGQRVPYVIVHGSPGLPLIQLVRTPNQVLQDPGLRLNTTYYLTRQLVPTLNRVFCLLGVDTMQWYQELPRWHRVSVHHQPGTPGKKGTISQYFASLNCVVCEKVTKETLCSDCKAKGQVTATALMSQVQQWQLVQQGMAKICASCCNFRDQDSASCVSLDCPIMFKTNKLARQLGQATNYQQLLDSL
ncbi:uncharacterized protein LOC110984687 isoform X2 [Acanthaster planci]|uniref:DNA polymerase zeta catalytic subunit n=1 Tax=Acanthaster planci TaxID=133434 RepID=A0A8B7ZC69_ACAPL|nr:uncharacterized protein LOC110984687 isoform X2 [Acanthaster planci]